MQAIRPKYCKANDFKNPCERCRIAMEYAKQLELTEIMKSIRIRKSGKLTRELLLEVV